VGEIQIRFRMNMESGKKDILIEYESDEDAMRHEHEKDHRNIVERIVGEGLIEAEEVGEVIVERSQPGQEVARPSGEQQEPPQQQATSTGG
jgi:hypothetical protein